MNRVVLYGRIANDILFNDGDVKWARITIAVQRPHKDGEESADFIRCVAFGKHAEMINKYFSKGKPILIEGRLKSGSYENKDGNKVSKTDVVIDRFEFSLSDKTKPDTVFGADAEDIDIPF